LKIGFHVSISGGIDMAVDRAVESGYTAFQIFTRNPRQWKLKALNSDATRRFIEKVECSNMQPVFAHMPYLPNLASPRDAVYLKSCASLETELRRCNDLHIPYLVTHLGSHLGTGRRRGFARVTKAINMAFEAVNTAVLVLLENTAGSRNGVGGTFEDIKFIVDGVSHHAGVGFCLDTSHAFAAGYDLRTKEAVEATIQRLDETLGLDILKCVHLNDSKRELGSRVDRHEHVGLGRIGEEGFRRILRSRLGKGPLILETPRDARRSDTENLKKVRELASRD
jgi:deoxyribonuclease-4